MKIIEFVATALTLIGFYAISEGNSHGFTISLISNVMWMFWGHDKNAISLMALNGIMIFINLNGLGVL